MHCPGEKCAEISKLTKELAKRPFYSQEGTAYINTSAITSALLEWFPYDAIAFRESKSKNFVSLILKDLVEFEKYFIAFWKIVTCVVKNYLKILIVFSKIINQKLFTHSPFLNLKWSVFEGIISFSRFLHGICNFGSFCSNMILM